MLKTSNKLWDQAAKDISPSLTRWVGPFLYSFARLLKAKQTVEIGIGRGFTSFALGLHAKDFGASHTTIDLSEERRAVAEKLNRTYDLDIEYIVANARSHNWEGAPIDLLFIDILGKEDDFFDIFSNFTPVVKRHGFILVHDYFCFAEIKAAVDWFFRGKPGYELLTIPSDGEPRMRPELEGPCGLAIVRKL